MWAPEIHPVNGTFYVYFSGRCPDTGHHAIGVAISSSGGPFGPYKDYGSPIIQDTSEVIDVTWFKDPRYI